ncbi:MAG: acyl-ACP--UDP-N-acetylglucosamine O-acyltransferase [Gammaproteobacteria bacterium]|nr:acyl-ACP--UDP-N-acetylglucosamine O-acyltransferase [Gammaproteobacteria bacterium]
MNAQVHATAIIDPGAQLGSEVSVGPFVVVEQNVVIGDRCRIESHAVVKRYTTLGRNNHIHEHAVIGGAPQDFKFDGGASYVCIGDNNIVRENVTIHRSNKNGEKTVVGDNNFLMAGCHVAHDCAIGSNIIMANNALLGGHVVVEDNAFISGGVTIHQFCRVGTLAMVSASARINLDCLPYVVTDGSPGRARGLNSVGLKRSGADATDLVELKRAYRLLCSGAKLKTILVELRLSSSPLVIHLVKFIEASQRGFAHHQKR